MKKICVVLVFLSLVGVKSSFAQQSPGSLLISGGADLIRSDNSGLFQRSQIGLEGNYFMTHWFSLSGGYEFNSNRNNQVTLGARVYPFDPVFVRARFLLGPNSDTSLGVGYSHNLTYRLRVEAITDYYIGSNRVGLRGGLAFLIN
ncbi:outer membrane beta-barrel protein [Pararhodonellum marinum]|uniref:outer membrane beta-barrel protein n=1 Tax=Pararhodonellum marinum TaxID=2755358 RepID=UPI0018909D80|nr:outer membrane beta-barrel protein [Pararhodonellum marinum]